jgi:chlorobactene glucosyltransferase
MVLVAIWANTLFNSLIVGGIRPSRTRERDLSLVSVLIPARNKERCIVPCLPSLLEQNYPHYDIVMLDDNSEDATGRCAEAIASRSSGHLRISSGATLPEGWTGKSRVCHQSGAGGSE